MIFCHIALVFIMIMIMTKKVHYHDHYEIIYLNFYFVLAPNPFFVRWYHTIRNVWYPQHDR